MSSSAFGSESNVTNARAALDTPYLASVPLRMIDLVWSVCGLSIVVIPTVAGVKLVDPVVFLYTQSVQIENETFLDLGSVVFQQQCVW